MAALILGRGRELDDADVARIETRDKPPDCPTLPRRVPALEQHADWWSKAPVADESRESEAKLEQAFLARLQPTLLLLTAELEAEVDGAESAHCHPMVSDRAPSSTQEASCFILPRNPLVV